jgi:hypothetical protein
VLKTNSSVSITVPWTPPSECLRRHSTFDACAMWDRIRRGGGRVSLQSYQNHWPYVQTINSSFYYSLVSWQDTTGLRITSLTHPCFDQGFPSISQLPRYFQDKGYCSPDDYTAGPFQYGHQTDLETYSFWLTKPTVINNFNIFMQGGKLKKEHAWTGKSCQPDLAPDSGAD